MKRLLTLISLLLTAVHLQAGPNDKVRAAYDIGFEMNFDNREYYKSDFSTSMTIFAARLTPSIGLALGKEHKVMVGVDAVKDFGSGKDNVKGETLIYYALDKKIRNTGLELYAGIFPRKASEGTYSQAFFSDSLRFYDSNLEGLLLKFHRPKAYFELGCDWMGQYGDNRRERFMVFSSGEGKVAPCLSLGYDGYMYHFASSEQVKGVVDNILVNPYVSLDLGGRIGPNTFSVRLGWLQALQNDRRNVGRYVRPGGGELDIVVMNWNIGIRNSLFIGTDMMPYYNRPDAGGIKYGSQLYFGDPFYRVHDDQDGGIGTYDRLEVFWTPKLGKYLDISVGARFHFNDFSYSGCQQTVRLEFNLNRITKRKQI